MGPARLLALRRQAAAAVQLPGKAGCLIMRLELGFGGEHDPGLEIPWGILKNWLELWGDLENKVEVTRTWYALVRRY